MPSPPPSPEGGRGAVAPGNAPQAARPDGAPEWAPERTITTDLVVRVLAEQFPSLAGLPVRPFDAGWDNILFRVGDDVVMRFIHRDIALRGAQVEVAVLQALPELPLPVPRPVHLGAPTPQVPWPFWGARLLPGRELATAGVPDEERDAVARDVGGFLRALHRPEIAAAVVEAVHAAGAPALPVDPMRRGDPGHTAAKARARLDGLVEAGVWVPDPAVTALLDRAASSGGGDPTEQVLVHGDLHVRHVLVGPRAEGPGASAAEPGARVSGLAHPGLVRASGVIDWGDTALADPSVDLAVGWAAFEGSAREAFLDAYGPVPPARELAARVLGVHMSASLALAATVDGLAPLAHESLAAVGRAAR